MKRVVICLVALVLFSGVGHAADWNFYGSARVNTFWSQEDVIGGADGDTNFDQVLLACSRIGANAKVSDEVTGVFEYGAYQGKVSLRHLYGIWDFGAGKLLIGQTDILVRFPGSSQVFQEENALGGTGELAGSRAPQLRLTFGGLQLAAVRPKVNYFKNGNETILGIDLNGDGDMLDTDVDYTTSSDTQVVIPSIQAKYTFTGNNWDLGVAMGYQTFDIDTASGSDDVNSYVLGIGGSLSFNRLTLKGNLYGGQNVSNLSNAYGKAIGTQAGYAYYKNGRVYDVDAVGYSIVLACSLNDSIRLEAGYGHLALDWDGDDTASLPDDNVSSYYFQTPITLASGVFLVPEIGVVDYEETGQNKVSYCGMKWQFNF